MLKLSGSISSVGVRGSKGITCLDPSYISDFSADADGWTGVQGISVLAGNRDGIGGADDSLQIRFASTTGGAVASITKTLSTGFTVGCTYNYRIKYRIPSANDEVIYITTLTAGGVDVTIHSSAQTPDTWVEASGTFVATSSSAATTIAFNAAHNAGTTDQAYINSIRIYL